MFPKSGHFGQCPVTHISDTGWPKNLKFQFWQFLVLFYQCAKFHENWRWRRRVTVLIWHGITLSTWLGRLAQWRYYELIGIQLMVQPENHQDFKKKIHLHLSSADMSIAVGLHNQKSNCGHIDLILANNEIFKYSHIKWYEDDAKLISLYRLYDESNETLNEDNMHARYWIQHGDVETAST